jgi:hypothetical protein
LAAVGSLLVAVAQVRIRTQVLTHQEHRLHRHRPHPLQVLAAHSLDLMEALREICGTQAAVEVLVLTAAIHLQ